MLLVVDFQPFLFVNLHLASNILAPEHGASTAFRAFLFENLHLASDIPVHEHNASALHVEVKIIELDQIVTRNTTSGCRAW